MILNILFLIVILLILFFLWVAAFDSNRFVTVSYRFSTDKIKKPIRFVFLTDLHQKQFSAGNDRLIAAISSLSPDFVLVGGDMLNASELPRRARKHPERQNRKRQKRLEPTTTFLKAVADCYPVYHAMGNHESRSKVRAEAYGTLYEDYRKQTEHPSIRFLDNESVFLPEENLTISGFSMALPFYKKMIKRQLPSGTLEKCLGKGNPDSYRILMAHNPEFLKDYAAWQPDLVLAGHVHGGVVRLPFLGLGGVISPSLRPFPHYDGGLFEEFGTRMILGRGLGSHTIPIRIFNPGELVSVELVPDTAPDAKDRDGTCN